MKGCASYGGGGVHVGGDPNVTMEDCVAVNLVPGTAAGIRIDGPATINAHGLVLRGFDQPVVNNGGDLRLIDPDITKDINAAETSRQRSGRRRKKRG